MICFYRGQVLSTRDIGPRDEEFFLKLMELGVVTPRSNKEAPK